MHGKGFPAFNPAHRGGDHIHQNILVGGHFHPDQVLIGISDRLHQLRLQLAQHLIVFCLQLLFFLCKVPFLCREFLFRLVEALLIPLLSRLGQRFLPLCGDLLPRRLQQMIRLLLCLFLGIRQERVRSPFGLGQKLLSLGFPGRLCILRSPRFDHIAGQSVRKIHITQQTFHLLDGKPCRKTGFVLCCPFIPRRCLLRPFLHALCNQLIAVDHTLFGPLGHKTHF